MKISQPAIVLFATVISLAADFTGEARFRGLFLWNGEYASANASDKDISGSISLGTLNLDASLYAIRANVSWENFWEISSRINTYEGAVKIDGDFRHLKLSAAVNGNSDFGRAQALSAIHAADSLFFIGLRFGGGSFGKIRTTWRSETPNGFLDSMRIDYQGEFIRKGVLLGSQMGNHSVFFDGNIFWTKRAPIEDSHYALRDSSTLWNGELHYRYKRGDSEWKWSARYFHLNSHFFGVRSEEDNLKRFLYLPSRANIGIFHGEFQNPNWEISLGGATGHLRLPHNENRFEETLAPNRALDQSLIQTLSFAVYKLNYRLYGDASGWLLHSQAGRRFHFFPGLWHISPKIAMNFLYAQGGFDVYLKSESVSTFLIQKSITETYHGDVKMSGAILHLNLLGESPKRRFFGSISLMQIIPFFVIKDLTKTDAKGNTSSFHPGSSSSKPENSSLKSDDSLHRSEHLSPFKTGFGIEVSVGLHF